MGVYRHNGFLPFIKIDQFNDWQLEGYFYNAITSLKNVPKDVLVGFRTPGILYSAVSAPSTMKLRKLSIVNNDISVISEQSVTSDLTVGNETISGVDYIYYYRNQTVFTANPAEYLTSGCIYDVYIIDSLNNEFISHPFLAIDNISTTSSKPIYKRNGLLPFYRNDQLSDWQMDGYHKNWILSLKKISKTSLAGFKTPYIEASLTVPANMTIRELKPVDNTLTVIDSQTIVSNLVKTSEVINGTTYYYYYRTQQDMSIILTAGCVYDIEITDGTNTFYSDIFLAVNEADRDYYLITEDNQQVLTEDDQYINIDI